MDGWTGLDWMDWILLRKLVLLEHLAMLIIQNVNYKRAHVNRGLAGTWIRA